MLLAKFNLIYRVLLIVKQITNDCYYKLIYVYLLEPVPFKI